ncbi:hypothetical protein IMG5_161080 [Ichthyophthirius multifiliis]|uniref:Uncharacterized protein n=1 Tax=Ichthyophthirius multifiliis TaxID=5932 RepID=G0R009_ICHMU|nr:hypothetical protein IMG5_161080 [Ichthyophthirius multifiliis]EGR29192.1 hypothetical protein IMG5_161080 [Ichthyophthirius multifiliis]|eukprot:XP_004030428.1 hypothetical protein IMG5_161080 [Ichthyophthirius multifiliis]
MFLMIRTLLKQVQLQQSLRLIPKYQFSKHEDDWLNKQHKSKEKLYFTQEEQKQMKKLLEKLSQTSKFVEDVEHETSDAGQVQKILQRYNISPSEALIEELTDWKKQKNNKRHDD